MIHRRFMKQNLAFAALLLSCCHALPQGTFVFYNYQDPTRIGSPTGPIAGPGIWGQALVGLTSGSLVPLGLPAEHTSFGIVPRQDMTVPFAPPYTVVQVQMAAWDGTVWGTDFARVPPDQLGFTDIVPVLLVDPLDPSPGYPHFTQPAVVPIPEPVTLALAGLAATLATRRRLTSRTARRS
jgi:hypothetical protein